MIEHDEDCGDTALDMQTVLAAVVFKLGGIARVTGQDLRNVAGLAFTLHFDEDGQATVHVLHPLALALPEVTHLAPEALQ